MTKAVVFAYHNIGCAGIKALVGAGVEIQCIFTHPDASDENKFFDSVAQLAAKLGIPAHSASDINHPLWVERIRALNPDIIFSFYYRHLLGEEILKLPRLGAYNLHGSLLPRYRGRAPVNWALVNGETETGVTLHKMTTRPDGGDIAAQERVAISDDDTALTLHEKMTEAAKKLLPKALPDLLAGKAKLTPQDESKATTFGRRTAADGKIDWEKKAVEVRNLVRAVTLPYPGAFTAQASGGKLIVWESRVAEGAASAKAKPGEVLSTDPFVVKCGEGALEIIAGQLEGGLYLRGADLAREAGVVEGAALGRKPQAFRKRPKRVLILGVNGFIGNHLTERLLAEDDYEIHGLDIGSDGISRFLCEPRFHFVEGDIGIHSEWIEYHIKKCDVVLPLVAIATPIEYVRNPLRVFELDFEENLKVVRQCVKYNKRIIFPSTSEVYGMCTDEEFDEDNSRLILGPINKQRWIYSASKQLLDRIIWAYGQKSNLAFTLFRPFNWIGPRLDSLDTARIGSSRAITQLILNLVEGTSINLVDGGLQKRCFTDISDGIEALFRIIENKGDRCNGQIINIGNPYNEASIAELGEMLLKKFEAHPLRKHFPPFAGFKTIESFDYYGKGYQDVVHRRPSIRNAKKLLDWTPEVPLEQAIESTLDFFLKTVPLGEK